MRKFNKKLVLSIVALVMISTLGFGKALGYFTAHTNATGGYKMDLGFTDTKIEEDVDKDGKHVVITNVGDYDCFVRVKVFAADNLKIRYNLGEDWQESGDGYIYYNKVLSSKDKTSELNIKYTLPEVNDDNKDKDYNIVVIQEFTPVVYDDQGNLIANWQQVYETE